MKASSLLIALLACVSGIGTAHAQAVASCRIVPGVHTFTFDGAQFDTLKTGTFGWVDSDALSVQAITATFNDKEVAVTKIAVRFGQAVYLYDMNGLQLTSGQSTDVTATQTGSAGDRSLSARLAANDGTLVEITRSVKIGTTWGSNVTISLPASVRGKVRGLCGNFDGNTDNDNLSPTGQPIQFTPPKVWLPDGTDLATTWVAQVDQDLFRGGTERLANTEASAAPATPAPATAAAPAASGQTSAAVCRILAGVHTITFDAAQFDVLEAGTFNWVDSDALSVEAVTATFNDKEVAPTKIAVRFGQAVYILDANELKLASGQSTGIEVSQTGSGAAGSLIARLTANDGTTVELAQAVKVGTTWGTNVTISLPASARGKVRGLCGNFDGNPSDDNLTPAGQPVAFAPAKVWLPDGTSLATAWVPQGNQDLFGGAQPANAGGASASAAPAAFGTVKIFKTTSAAAGHPSAQMCLPPGYRLLGGGASLSTTGVGNYLTASYPDGQCWKAEAKDHLVQSIATMDVYAIGIYDPNAVIATTSLSTTSPPAAHPAIVSQALPPPFVLTGGGAKVTYGGAGNILVASYPNDGNPPNSWVAASKDHEVSDPATVTAYAIGMLTQVPTGEQFDIVKVVATQANPAAGAEATVALPQGYSVIGGGGLALSTTQAGSLLTDSYPSGNGWTVRSHDRDVSDPAKIAVWAIGIRQVQ